MTPDACQMHGLSELREKEKSESDGQKKIVKEKEDTRVREREVKRDRER